MRHQHPKPRGTTSSRSEMSAPIAWLHDEIVLEVPAGDAKQAAELLERAMAGAFVETFPGAPRRGLVEPHIGLSWGEAKS